MKRKDVYTTGDIALICRVSMRTAAKWCDSGGLTHHHIGKDRRVTREALAEFMNRNRMPVRWLEEMEVTQ